MEEVNQSLLIQTNEEYAWICRRQKKRQKHEGIIDFHHFWRS